MDRSGTRCAPRCGIGIRTRCRSCSRCRSSGAWIGIWRGSRRRWWVIRKREPRWQSAADRARVAAELIEEAASLTDESTIASPADVARAGLPPPISAELPPSAPPGGAAAGYYLGEALNHVDDRPPAQAAYERAGELEPGKARALHRLGIVLDRLNRPAEATRMYRRSREAAAR